MLNRFAVASLVVLVACGGGDSPSSPTPTPVPTPTPAPISYAGTFSGDSMTFTDDRGVRLAVASVRIAESGGLLVFGDLAMTTPHTANYPLGGVPHTNGRFEGSTGYNSLGCGRATGRFGGYFSADARIMNFTMTLTFSSGAQGCGGLDIRGELGR
ncbi:MAG TPA: hypothetical protein VIJ10_17215 [Vicinamibacteria bacterium]|jgi:hypothetical protein